MSDDDARRARRRKSPGIVSPPSSFQAVDGRRRAIALDHATNAFAAATAVDEDAPEVSFTKWQAAGWDKGSTVGKMPSPAGIAAMMRDLLHLK